MVGREVKGQMTYFRPRGICVGVEGGGGVGVWCIRGAIVCVEERFVGGEASVVKETAVAMGVDDVVKDARRNEVTSGGNVSMRGGVGLADADVDVAAGLWVQLASFVDLEVILLIHGERILDEKKKNAILI